MSILGLYLKKPYGPSNGQGPGPAMYTVKLMQPIMMDFNAAVSAAWHTR